MVYEYSRTTFILQVVFKFETIFKHSKNKCKHKQKKINKEPERQNKLPTAEMMPRTIEFLRATAEVRSNRIFIFKLLKECNLQSSVILS